MKKIIGLICAFTLVFAACDVESSDSNSTDSKESSNNYSVGDVVKVGDVEYTVNSISTSKEVGSSFLTEQSKGTFLVVNLTVKNNGSDELMVHSSLFNLVNGDKEYASSGTASIYANENADFFLEMVNPDLSLTGNVVFDISDETIESKDLQLKVQTGIFGTETELIYLNK